MSDPKTGAGRVYLSPAEYVDSDHPIIREAAARLVRDTEPPADRARALYYEVRDNILYGFPDDQPGVARKNSLADYFRDLETYRASSVLAARYGYCVSKAAVYTALCRAADIPARVAFANVRNHFSTRRLRQAMGTDLFAWHGYSELFLNGRWVKVTPTFNATLCRRLGVKPLEFDGVSDALLQPFDTAGRTFLTYVTHHGAFHDVPARFLADELPRLYPGIANLGWGANPVKP